MIIKGDEMSKREMVDNAKSLGRKAFWDNKSRSSNPMRGKRSRQAWEEAWEEEDKFTRWNTCHMKNKRDPVSG